MISGVAMHFLSKVGKIGYNFKPKQAIKIKYAFDINFYNTKIY